MPERRFHLLADQGYTTGEVLNGLSANCDDRPVGRQRGPVRARPGPRAGDQGQAAGARLPGPADMLAGRRRRTVADAFGLRGW